MLNFFAILVIMTIVVGLLVGLINLYFGSKQGGLAAHAERVALSPFDWKTAVVTMIVLYVILFAVAAMIFYTGFGSFLITFVALPINMNLGHYFHRALCSLIHSAHGAPVPMPAAA